MFLRVLLRLGTFFVVLLACSATLNRLWSRHAGLLRGSGPGSRQEATSPALKSPLTLLLMGLAPKEEQQLPRIGGVLLVHLAPGQPVRLLQAPGTTPVVVPGSGAIDLERAYNIGGVRLVAELLETRLNRPEDLVDRYILSSSPALAAFVDAMGGVPMTLDPPPPPQLPPTPPQPPALVVAPQGEEATAALQAQATDPRTSSPGAGPWAELGSGARQLSGAQVQTYLHASGPAPGSAWQLERQRRLLGAMVHHLDSEDLRQRWPQLARDLLDASRTNLSQGELFSVLAMLQAQPLRLVVEPLSPEVGVQTHFWPRSRPVPDGTVLVEGPLPAAMAFKQQLEARGTNAAMAPTPPDGITLSRTRLLAWDAEPPASVTSLLGAAGHRRQDAPLADAAITVRLGTDWSPYEFPLQPRAEQLY